MSRHQLDSSFRDPSGTVCNDNGKIYRKIYNVYKNEYNFLIRSGLYKELIKLKLLIPHKEIETKEAGVFKVVQPVKIPFVTYPYEWCFSQLKDAALTTLRIQMIAIKFGMILKDASIFNIQFYKGKPILIDTLSFRIYKTEQTWIAYHQFCTHFLAPLLLMTYVHPALNRLLRIYLDGIPLELASHLLPIRCWVNPAIISHIHIHARMQNRFGKSKINNKKRLFGKIALLGLIENLQNIIEKLSLNLKTSKWSDYYLDNNYSVRAFANKKKIVSVLLREIKADVVWDLGANCGIFSHLAAKQKIFTISFDEDPLVVEKNYLFCKKNTVNNCLPLVLDITNPTPSVGWDGKERVSIFERGPADAVLALALIHHLVIANNIPFEKICSFLSRICNKLVIEFIPKEDSQVQLLLQNRLDIFDNYNSKSFEAAFCKSFSIKKIIEIPGSKRSIYLMENKKQW